MINLAISLGIARQRLDVHHKDCEMRTNLKSAALIQVVKRVINAGNRRCFSNM